MEHASPTPLLLPSVVVVVDVVVVVVVGHTSVTVPPGAATSGEIQLSSTNACGDLPSGHAPALVIAAENLSVAFVMQPESTGRAFAAAFA